MGAFQTPPWCCDVLASMVPRSVKLVLEPMPGDGFLVQALVARDLEVETPPGDFWTFQQDMTLRFDAVVMNPAFSPVAVGINALARCLKMSDTVIAVLPWLTILNS